MVESRREIDGIIGQEPRVCITSHLLLSEARLRHIAGTYWSTRKYVNMAPLYAEQNSKPGAVA